MICHVELNNFMPKGNNDMIQCVTCNKSSLFAPRQGMLFFANYVFEV